MGGDAANYGSTITISGGTVKVTAKKGHSDIGVGQDSKKAAIIINGGSVFATRFSGVPTDGTNQVYQVKVPGLVSGSEVSLEDLPAHYGTKDIVADKDGNVYLWLPWQGNAYMFTADNQQYEAKVDSANIVAQLVRLFIDEQRNNVFKHAATLDVGLYRSFTPSAWNTLVLPFALTTEEVEEAFGKDAQVAYFTNTKTNTIELNTKSDTKAIEANTPVLIKTTKEVPYGLTFTSRTIVPATEAMVKGDGGINFIGSYAESYDVKEGEYFIAGDKLWKSTGATTLKATRAYFTVPEEVAKSEAKLRLVINDGTTTGISSVRSEESGERSYGSAVYTLFGQKVADSLEEARKLNLKQGVYIVNGKKIVVK